LRTAGHKAPDQIVPFSAHLVEEPEIEADELKADSCDCPAFDPPFSITKRRPTGAG